jgi:hypothetical protein
MSSFGPVFAAGFQELVALIFVMVSVIGWVIKTVQGNNQQLPPPVQRPGKRREERTADELDSFLQQVNRQAEPQPQPPPPRRQHETGGRSGGNRSRPQAPVGSQPSVSQRPPAKNPQRQSGSQQPVRRLVEDSASRREAAGIGVSGSGGVAQHTREHMSERIGQEAKRDVGQDIRESVRHSMGTGLVAPVETGTSVRKTASELFAKEPSSAAECSAAKRMESLRRMLSNPESIRQAVVIQEILNRPKCLR